MLVSVLLDFSTYVLVKSGPEGVETLPREEGATMTKEMILNPFGRLALVLGPLPARFDGCGERRNQSAGILRRHRVGVCECHGHGIRPVRSQPSDELRHPGRW